MRLLHQVNLREPFAQRLQQMAHSLKLAGLGDTATLLAHGPFVDRVSQELERIAIQYVQDLVDSSYHPSVFEQGRKIAELLEPTELLESFFATDTHPDPLRAIELVLLVAKAIENKTPRWPSNVKVDDIANALERTRQKDAQPLAKALRSGMVYTEDGIRGIRLDAQASPPRIEPKAILHHIAQEREHHPNGVGPSMTQEHLTLLVDQARGHIHLGTRSALHRWPLLLCAQILSIRNHVIQDLHRPSIGVDAGTVHHDLVTTLALASSPKGRVNAIKNKSEPRLEFSIFDGEIRRNKAGQLSLPISSEWDGSIQEQFFGVIKQWCSAEGLRNWAALQKLFSVEGKREGTVIWKLDDHLDAIGASFDMRQSPDKRDAIVREIKLLTKIEMALYDKKGTLRFREPILRVDGEVDINNDGVWRIAGLKLTMNKLLYNGVRAEDGKLGNNWFPAPIELATLDPARYPYAIALGFLLCIRWRWAWGKGEDSLVLRARALLSALGIPFTERRASKTWKTLDRNTQELQRIHLIGEVAWKGEKTLDTLVRFSPSSWLRDRTYHGLAPIEAKRSDLPCTGLELKAWRKKHRFTQSGLAAKLKLGLSTIERAEAKTKDHHPLPTKLVRSLQSFKPDAPEPPADGKEDPGTP